MTTIRTMTTARLLAMLPQASGVLRDHIERTLRDRGLFLPVVVGRSR